MKKELTQKRYSFLKSEASKLLKLSNNSNPFSLASTLGIDVNICSLKGELFGFILDNVIYINKELDWYSKKIICAHELGHYVLHQNYDRFELFDTDNDSISELEANLFVREIMSQVFSRVDMNKIVGVSDFNNFVESQIRYSKQQ